MMQTIEKVRGDLARAQQEVRRAELNVEIAKVDAIINEVGVFLYAPPLPEALRRAGLLRKLMDDNPE